MLLVLEEYKPHQSSRFFSTWQNLFIGVTAPVYTVQVYQDYDTILDIDFPGGKCNLKMNIRGEKDIKEKFIYVSLLKCNIFRMEKAK